MNEINVHLNYNFDIRIVIQVRNSNYKEIIQSFTIFHQNSLNFNRKISYGPDVENQRNKSSFEAGQIHLLNGYVALALLGVLHTLFVRLLSYCTTIFSGKFQQHRKIEFSQCERHTYVYEFARSTYL